MDRERLEREVFKVEERARDEALSLLLNDRIVRKAMALRCYIDGHDRGRDRVCSWCGERR